ncbi:MAG: heavy metal translocating P-type ATPase [Bacteroidota bacterium]|nr:heavy metal translocating P-type ATPase [Bacteroidota bacterium]
MKELISDKKFRFLIAALILVAVFEILSVSNIHLDNRIAIPLFAIICLAIGYKTLWSGLKNLVKFNFKSINTLMTIAVAGAFYLGEYPEASIVIVLFTIGEYLERFGVLKSRAALTALLDKVPKTANVKSRGEEVPINEINVGDIMIIKPGDGIALDGEVTEGASSVDEATITGEPLPNDKRIGDAVYAGTINKQGYLEVRVTKKSRDTTLSKIIELTFKATSTKADTQKFIEKFSAYYTPAIIIISVLIVCIPVFFFNGNFDEWLLMGLTLLVISCPCALVISTPVSIYSAVGNASSKGIIIKGGKYIEAMSEIKAIALDKTRTITHGKPIVSDVIPLNGFNESDVIACATGLEIFSEHPIAQSIIEKAKEENIKPHEMLNFKAVMGKGVKGECIVCNDKAHYLGSVNFITENTELLASIEKQVDALQNEGKTALVLSNEKNIEGIIAVTDEIKEESKEVIQQLKELNIIPIILTGDHEKPANYVAKKVGIEEVLSSLLPENKAEEISKLLLKYGKVCMVGDGINDAPALATATVGIAMGGAGSDAAIQTADITLMNDNLRLIPFLIKLSRKTMTTIKFNTIFAISIKIIFILLAVFELSNLVMAILADVGVTVFVIIYGLRLIRYST